MKQWNFLVENISRCRYSQKQKKDKKDNGSENNTKSRNTGMNVIKKLLYHKGNNSS